MNATDEVPEQFKKEFESTMQELVKRGLMRQTGPGTYAITDAGDAYVDAMADAATERRVAQLEKQQRALLAAAQATLMFHGGGPWSHADREAWLALTGREEASTRTLCDFVREQLEAAE